MEAIFEEPVRSDILWTDVEGLFNALGAEISEGRGSRVRIALKGMRAVFHRPHPTKETKDRICQVNPKILDRCRSERC